ncbi:MAG: APC family permease [Betaproteobacteria bacterium]|nr:APC family permease [Betaproteobacteria bacterium]MBU6513268.1 APC family permease [Betaproteobacteria bacterium]MDE1956222.1 APC family permease [Betaproteobacteria bacterium]MDE2153600.1 APC family permease [Betaproteobacteria bacterium]
MSTPSPQAAQPQRSTRISTWQLALLSTGSMIGSGWLFSPFYGLQTAGGAVLLAWVLAAALSLVVSLSFARMCTAFPVVGGTYRLLGITHPRSTANVFLILGWLSYVVFLPLEAQSVVQYLAFWWPGLVRHLAPGEVQLSWSGLGVGVLLIVGITWFNTLHITRVAQANAWVSLWKVLVPVVVALAVITLHGRREQFVAHWSTGPLALEPAMMAVIGSGLAFAFAGFQNGLILANQVREPRRSLPFSLYLPLSLGLLLYMLLSASFMATTPTGATQIGNAAAPLLGLVSVLGLGLLMPVLLADAVVAPMGTANVFVAVTGRILYACGYELRPGSRLTRLNLHGSPVFALWINAAVGLLFLLPFPTWKELVSFLSSMVVFTFLAGPVSLLVFCRASSRSTIGVRSTLRARVVGVAGFLCSTWLVYWGGRHNLGLLLLALVLAVSLHGWLEGRLAGLLRDLRANAYLVLFVSVLCAMSWARHLEWLGFPWDNVAVAVVGGLACAAFLRSRLGDAQIEAQVQRLGDERRSDAMAAAQG